MDEKKVTQNEESNKSGEFSSFMSRRGFMRSSAFAGLLLTSKSAIAQEESKTLKLGLAGLGAQGERLTNCIHKLPNNGNV